MIIFREIRINFTLHGKRTAFESRDLLKLYCIYIIKIKQLTNCVRSKKKIWFLFLYKVQLIISAAAMTAGIEIRRQIFATIAGKKYK